MLKQLKTAKKSPDFQKVSFVQSEISRRFLDVFLETLETKIHFLLDQFNTPKAFKVVFSLWKGFRSPKVQDLNKIQGKYELLS